MSSEVKKETIVLSGRAFLGEIRQNVTGEGKDKKVQFFVTISFPHGKGEKRKYQYLSCFVSNPLNHLFTSLHDKQVKGEDDKAVHPLTSQLASITIEAPFFELNDGFMNGSGILTSVAF